MAKERKQNRRSYQEIKEQTVSRFTDLVDRHGVREVPFFVLKDNFVLNEAVRPLVIIGQTFPILHQLQGRTIEDKDVADFKTEYFEAVAKLEALKDKGVELLIKTGYRNIPDWELRTAVREKVRENSSSKESSEEKAS